MRRTAQGRLYVAGLVLVLTIGAAIGWQLFTLREPTYRGRTLSHWLWQHVQSADISHPNPAAHQAAAAAIHHIGTNALPTLLAWAGMTDSPSKKRTMMFLGEEMCGRLGLLSASDYHARASYGFRLLKAAAKPAVPELCKLLNDADPGVRSGAAACLCCIGPAAHEAVPTLLRSLADSEAQNNAWAALGCIGTKPDVVVPVLIDYLSSTNVGLQGWASWHLAEYGTNARVSVPRLLGFLDSPEDYLRRGATNSLPKIDPVAAAKAGVK